MNTRFLNTIALLSCWAFLVCNIIYDLLEKSQAHLYIDMPNIKDYTGWYFIPQSVMILVLIILGKDAAVKEPKHIQSQWFFFFALALSNVLKNCLFNPLEFRLNEYWYLALCLLLTLYKHFKKR